MSTLQEVIRALPPRRVANVAELDSLSAGQWDEFAVSDEERMAGHKLLHRKEEVRWPPPVLTFVVERYGGTVCGSRRAELQHWAVNLDAKTATITKTGYRQLAPMAPRISIKAMADEIVGRSSGKRRTPGSIGSMR
jgi:hypothetical protein